MAVLNKYVQTKEKKTKYYKFSNFMNTNVGHVQHKMVGRENGTSEIKTVFNGRDITSLEANILFKKKKKSTASGCIVPRNSAIGI